MVFIKRQIVPRSVAVARTYNGINSIKSVTIHQTGNTNRGANAQAHANIQSRLNPRQASWHYSVDDKEIIQSFEDTAQCFHAGDGRGPGNLSSVSIEICINSDGDYDKAVQNAAELTKYLLDKYGLSIKDVKQHYDWSRKNCPAQIRAGKNGITWSKFLDMVANNAPVTTKPAPKSVVKSQAPSSSKSKSIAEMADEVEAGIHGNGHENRRKSLGISSSEYAKVRAEVNRRAGAIAPKSSPKAKPKQKSIAQMAQEVIDGKHGNGNENRRKSLGISASEYEKVREEVNRRASGSSSPSQRGKSIAQMAAEILRGDHGNGNENRRKSLGISRSEYEKVRAEVNRRS